MSSVNDHAAGHGDWTRRDFIRRLSAAIAALGLDACTRTPSDRILPYAEQPPELTPSRATWYATSLVRDGFAVGVLAESRDGRPIKIEGNAAHPASRGGTGVFEQAAVWQLYDPDRARTPMHRSAAVEWKSAGEALRDAVSPGVVGARGEGLRVILAPTGSPSDAELLDRIRHRYPSAGIHFSAPFVPRSTWTDRGAMRGLVALHDFRAARIVFSIDADCLGCGPNHLRDAHDHASARAALRSAHRLYVAESAVSVTGASADHRFRIHPADAASLVAAALAYVRHDALPGDVPPWLTHVIDDLAGARGASLVVAGDRLDAATRAQVAALNDALGNSGRTVRYARSPLYGAGGTAHDVTPCVDALDARAVTTLVCIGTNVAYGLSGVERFARGVRTVPYTFSAGLYEDETSELMSWFLPLAHDLERWGDARAYDGTASIVQPLIEPIHGAMSQTEVLGLVAGTPVSAYDHVRSTWRNAWGNAGDADEQWARALARGVIENSAAPTVSVRPGPVDTARATRRADMTVMILPDSGVHDGSLANVPWLQEFPRPVTTLTWTNAAHMSPQTAAQLGVADGDVVRIRRGSGEISLPALIVAAHADRCVSVSAGYGRDGAERVANGLGSNAFLLQREPGEFMVAAEIEVVAGMHVPLARTQNERRALPPDVPLMATAGARPPAHAQHSATLYRHAPVLDAPHQWAMTIDLDRCIGCGACTVACQAENNVPVVGEDDVRRGRAMHWLRIDTYDAPAAGVDVAVQPMLCQHCEQAPCEYVCPVAATTHSPDGLNEMTYNRCVGTRFCSNNCPYKVRRFNWFDYAGHESELVQLARNPDVTVRARGVMEKCTFCVQRIREAEIAASVEHRDLATGDVVTACQQACPTQAIVFGSLTDAGARESLARDDDRAFDALGHLGTKPRVRYLSRRRNVNPAVEQG